MRRKVPSAHFFQGSDTRPFRITIATDKSDVPHVLVATRNLDLIAADQFSPKDQDKISWWEFVVLGLFFGVFSTLLDLVRPRVYKFLQRIGWIA